MKNKLIIKQRLLTIFSSILFLLVGSCDSFVEVAQPNSQLTSEAVFKDYTTATAAMKDVYAKMRDSGLLTGKSSGLTHLLGQYTDELISYQTSETSAFPFYNNSLVSTHIFVRDNWNSAYSQIYAANAVIKGVNASTVLTAQQKNQLIGEALFVRALLHSYLVGVYNACPYVTSTNYEQNLSLHRLPINEVYALCIADLEQAVSLLPVAYVGTLRSRPNKRVAQALLARLYLYTSQWAAASNAASAVLNETSLYVWEPDFNKVFLKGSTSTLWQFAAAGTVGNTQEGLLFVFNAGPPSTASLTTALFAAFEQGDLRKTNWTRTITGNATWHHSYKYKQGMGSSATTEHSVVLRLAEQYLIRAEARAQQGELTTAKEDLNFIRNNAGLPNTDALTQQDILEAILRERRVELFTEMGHRFFDLKRTGKLNAVLSIVKPGWNNTDSSWPVPESELLINPNLAPQNEGY
jgi:hypothetical protein